MKMGTALFWGLLFIVIGLALVFKIVFNLDFPLIRVIIAFVLIFLGIRMLVGGFGFHSHSRDSNDVIFGEKYYSKTEDGKEYNVIFGKGTYEFTDSDSLQTEKRVKIGTIFGASLIKINKDMPVKIKVDAAFASVELPNGNSTVFGNTVYESPGLDTSKPYLDLKLDVVFGEVDVKFYK